MNRTNAARLAVLLAIGVLISCAGEPASSPTQPSFDAATFGGEKHDPGLSSGRAQLFPYDQSGIKGVIEFTDDGSTLTVSGHATGFAPGVPYASLIYDNRSVPGGPEACEPAIFDPEDPDFILPTMLIGFWVNNGDGTGTLDAVNTNDGADYVPLSKIKTISIRDAAAGFARVACGEVARHK